LLRKVTLIGQFESYDFNPSDWHDNQNKKKPQDDPTNAIIVKINMYIKKFSNVDPGFSEGLTLT